ncbi:MULTISPECIES: dTDP-4-dehydrorhamnose reductase family protein [Paenibacillus]|uniref:dTDP-4-dehydrorhamnose reductase n=2 Tax=Paenibacillus lactis TaxID=228574 RepID=G4HI13_9BACL|nr:MULTISPECIES: SDR family oxidoreductase [Paenibacillus]EHB62986.1 NAD-dependent epimerase/dehydratase [Paenibacillus lactis 154]MBP1894714.1 dTDP-4-dehydrorhamnose reductase [Paenibacillus lactis]MCM3495796.1 SDR family oxidoreductase [Paenibacillus lactis]GIO92853.1 NAD(P)-dependent oxidoreductase [Paenibacillus lactis]HAG00181.1 SDR family NAD(P)-dependent oxidoreductase [Paenibacillus lactis]
MKMLILGGNGMAGHILVQYFQQSGKHHVFYTTRDSCDSKSLVLDVTDMSAVEHVVRAVRPDIIINAVGVLNQRAEDDKINAYHINGFLPHRLRYLADAISARLIHISTDCVFLGNKGGYREDDLPDGISAYALTKALGEVREPDHLTIRTSIIGPEIRPSGIGLFNWFMKQRGEVTGYRAVKWNGVTTLELAKAIDFFMNKDVGGLIHLGHPNPVSKYDLLLLFKDIWGKQDVDVVPSDEFVQDRTLRNTRLDAVYPFPDYVRMLKEMYEWQQAH